MAPYKGVRSRDKGGTVINTIIVYGVARTENDNSVVLDCELYVDKKLADAACNQSPATCKPYMEAKVWEFTLVRNCVKSARDAEEFFQHLNSAEAEVLLGASGGGQSQIHNGSVV